MGVLAVGAIVAGWIGIPEALGGNHAIGGWFGDTVHASHAVEYSLMALNTAVVLLGIGAAYLGLKQGWLMNEAGQTSLLRRAFYADEIVRYGVVVPLQKLSHWIARVVDIRGIDGVIMGLSWGLVRLGKKAEILQNGNLRAYVFAMMAGVGLFSLYLLRVL